MYYLYFNIKGFSTMPGIYILEGTVKHYDWGGYSFIPALLNIKNELETPFAEYWLGTHHNDSCKIKVDGHSQLLADFIHLNPGVEPLPYLLKVLDVREMLSIQVHPSKAAAEKEFARENSESIPLDAKHRNYKDDNHKPELMVALNEFWLLHGFKPKEKLLSILKAIPELIELVPVFEKDSYEGLYQHVMLLPQQDVNRILQPLIDRILPLYNTGHLAKNNESYWVAKAAPLFSPHNNIDRGIFSIYFFNLVKLEKGEGIFQGAGVPHAYLEGQNVEIMASSDNVLRGGLTNKHIDVKELLKHIKCEPTHVEVLKGEDRGDEKVYSTDAPEFQLSAFYLQNDKPVQFKTVTSEILLLIQGEGKVSAGGQGLQLKKGNPAAIAFPGQTIELTGQQALVFRASVPDHRGK
jgi:mannose-6-phosphate isomerase